MAQIILNEKEVENALKLDITSKTRKIIENTSSIREGEWMYLKIIPDMNLRDIENLILVRSPVKKQVII